MKLESPVKEFPGSVEVYDVFTFPMVMAIEAAMVEASSYFDPVTEDGEPVISEVTGLPVQALKEGATRSAVDYAYIPAILLCVKAWKLKNFPKDVSRETFPATPRDAAFALVDWVLSEIMDVYQGEKKVPKE